MVDVFVERVFEPPIRREDVFAMAVESGGCFGLYKVDWVESFLSLDGYKMLCHFRSPDAESVRVAFQQVGKAPMLLWPGTVHVLTDTVLPTVLVERAFELPVTLEDIQSREDQNAWCLETREVRFHSTFYACDQKRMICLYQAPDAEAVREAQRQAGMPMQDVWAFQHIRP